MCLFVFIWGQTLHKSLDVTTDIEPLTNLALHQRKPFFKLHFQSKGRDKNGNFSLGWLIRVKAVVFNLLSSEVKYYIKSSMLQPRYNHWPILHCIIENLIFKLHFQSKGRDTNINFLLGWLISEKKQLCLLCFHLRSNITLKPRCPNQDTTTDQSCIASKKTLFLNYILKVKEGIKTAIFY